MFEEDLDRVTKPRRVGDIYLYRVRPGDNVYRIARNFDTKIEWIACLNGLNQNFMIYPDQQLYIPFIPKTINQMPNTRESYELYF
ncbi:MAG: LysM peptidoglycan-binding domain-containing protein [Faecalibacillus sp.]